MQKDTISVNSLEEELDEPVVQHPIAFLDDLEQSDTGGVLLEVCNEHCRFWSNQQCCVLTCLPCP